MPVQQSHYEELLCEYSDSTKVVELLKKYRPYLEMMPSMRRPKESVIPIPLPTVRVREPISPSQQGGFSAAAQEVIGLPCDLGIIMCDPEWQIKVGVEIFVFIYRPYEDFSDLLMRWRNTQIWLSHGYEWLMPLQYKYILGDAAESIYPLFVIFEETPQRIIKGLKGAGLPFVVETIRKPYEYEAEEPLEEFITPSE